MATYCGELIPKYLNKNILEAMSKLNTHNQSIDVTINTPKLNDTIILQYLIHNIKVNITLKVINKTEYRYIFKIKSKRYLQYLYLFPCSKEHEKMKHETFKYYVNADCNFDLLFILHSEKYNSYTNLVELRSFWLETVLAIYNKLIINNQ